MELSPLEIEAAVDALLTGRGAVEERWPLALSLNPLIHEERYAEAEQILAAALTSFGAPAEAGFRARLWKAGRRLSALQSQLEQARERLLHQVRECRQRLRLGGPASERFHWMLLEDGPLAHSLQPDAELLREYALSLQHMGAQVPDLLSESLFPPVLENWRFFALHQPAFLRSLRGVTAPRLQPLLAGLRPAGDPAGLELESIPRNVLQALLQLTETWMSKRGEGQGSTVAWVRWAQSLSLRVSTGMLNRAAHDHLHAGRPGEAWALYQELLERSEPPPELDYYAGHASLEAGDLEAALTLLARAGNEAADWMRALVLENHGRDGELRELLQARADSGRRWEISRRFRAGAEEVRRYERELALLRMSPAQVEEIERKLSRDDLVFHPMFSLILPRRIVLRPLLVHSPTRRVDTDLALLTLEASADFLRRELGRACPPIPIEEPLEACASASVWPFDQFRERAGRQLRQLFPRAFRRRAECVAVVGFYPGEAAFSYGYAQPPRITGVALGTLRLQACTLVAHELGHSVLDLFDESGRNRPLEDDLSLMGYGWDGPLDGAFLGLRTRAALLATPEAFASARRGLAALKREDRRLAAHHLREAWRQDRWFLAAGQRAVALLTQFDRAGAAALAREVLEHFPSVGVECGLAEAQGHRRLLPLADPGWREREEIVAWEIRHGSPARSRKAAAQTSPDIDVLYAQGRAALYSWRLKPALRFFREVLKLQEAHTGALESLGIAFTYLGRLEEARSTLRRAGRWRPEYDYHLSRATADWERALAAIRRVPHYPLERAMLAFRRGLPEEAVSSLRKAWTPRSRGFRRAFEALLNGRLDCAAAQARRSRRWLAWRPECLDLLAYLEPEGGWREELLAWLPTWPGLLGVHYLELERRA